MNIVVNELNVAREFLPFHLFLAFSLLPFLVRSLSPPLTRTHMHDVKNRVALEKLCEIVEVVINPDSQEIYGRDFSTDSKFSFCPNAMP